MIREIEINRPYDKVKKAVIRFHEYDESRHRKLIHRKFEISGSSPCIVTWNDNRHRYEVAKINKNNVNPSSVNVLFDEESAQKSQDVKRGQLVLESVLSFINP